MFPKCDIPLITDIKRGSLVDGPGIRSVVFFKGCPLQCIFCHNPETQDRGMEISFSAHECIKCGECSAVCPEKAIEMENPDRIDRDRCIRCGECTKVCPGKGLRLIGSYFSIEELKDILLRDIPFYRHSGGGVTISGGECTLYSNYLESLLKTLKMNGIHIVLQTSGFFDFHTFKKKILPYIDLIYYDIKIADPEVHKKYTGKSNDVIIDNFYRILKMQNVEVYPRIPLIPRITATNENLSAIVDLVCNAGAENISLLPYNPLGLRMAENLGKPVPELPKTFMKPDEEKSVIDMLESIIREKRKTFRRIS